MAEIKRKSNTYVTKFLATALLFTVTAGVVGAVTSAKKEDFVKAVSTANEKPTVIVLDPGHGGEDPGASSDTGVKEKDLNLKISDVCFILLKAYGFDVRMTRKDDRLLYDLYNDLDDYEGKKKAYDLKNRIRFADECGADLFVSIHLNKFFRPQYGGLQVYYSANDPASKEYASAVQETVREKLSPDNERQIKKATSSIYLLKNIERSAILVECGFLSNPKDLLDLTNERYQLDLCATICSALMNELS